MNDFIEPAHTAPPMRIRVLILEDNPSDADLMVQALRQVGLDPEWQRVQSESDFVSHLVPGLDLILSDYTLPQFTGLQALQLVRSWAADVPFILVSGTIGEESAVEAMRSGADDYLLKDRMARLGPAVLQALEKRRLRLENERAESARRDSETKLRELIEQASDGIFVTDTHGRILLANSRYCEMLGYGEDEVVGLDIAETYPAEERKDFRERVGQLARVGHRLIERMMRRKDGICFPAEISIKYLANGTHQGIVRDITERKLAEAALRDSELRFRSFMSHLPGRASMRDLEGRYTFVNETWLRAFGLTEGDVVGRTPEDTFPSERAAALRPTHDAVLDRNQPVSRTFRLDNGTSPQWWFATHFPIPDATGTRALVGTIALDITEQKTREEKIDKLSRVRAITSEVNSLIVRVSGRQELFDGVCRIAAEHGRFGIAWAGIYDAEHLEVTPVASAGLEDSSFLMHTKTVVQTDLSRSKSVVDRAIGERRSVWSNDITLNTESGGERRKEAIRRGYRSVIVLPLIADGAVKGIVSMFAKELNFFDDEEVGLLTELAGNISFALDHMSRQEKIDKLSRIRAVSGEINSLIVRVRSRQELFDGACRIAVEHGKFGLAWIGSYDPAAQEVEPVAWSGTGLEDLRQHKTNVRPDTPQGEGNVGRAIRERKPVFSNSIEPGVGGRRLQEMRRLGYRSVIALPLSSENAATGVIVLFAGEPNFFTDEEVSLLSELAGNISLALQSIAQQGKVEYLSYYDIITGLPNRTLFIDRSGQQLRSRSGEPTMVAVVLLNLERFRNINETFGRHGGDELLRLVAQRLEHAFHGKDYLARIGADSFGIVIRGIRDAANVANVVEGQVLACFREPYNVGGSELRVAAKAGIALSPADGRDADTLFKNAEAALKKSRDSGERYLFYAAEMNARAAQALSLETRLRKAVESRQFVLHYQPKIDLASGAICGLEALIRWQEPGTGLVPPGAFIPLLEETGLILEVGRWALAEALEQHRAWTARGCKVPRIAVNVSAIQLQQKDFADVVISTVLGRKDSPTALELEVTESLLMKDVEASIGKLSILREFGIQIAMDDFGTGYSSLSYVARLPIHAVKIDRSFINGMARSEQAMAIVTTIIALAHSLNLKVVAEGVETEEQARMLAVLKCDEVQGFLYSKPLPADEIEPRLRAQVAEMRPGGKGTSAGQTVAPVPKTRQKPRRRGRPKR